MANVLLLKNREGVLSMTNQLLLSAFSKDLFENDIKVSERPVVVVGDTSNDTLVCKVLRGFTMKNISYAISKVDMQWIKAYCKEHGVPFSETVKRPTLQTT